MKPALNLSAIEVSYRIAGHLFGTRSVPALRGVDINVEVGECVGIVGESGCGKSTLAAVAAGLIDADAGDIALLGKGLPRRASSRPLAARRDLQIVFQDPYSSLDPTQTVAAIVGEGLEIHRLGDAAARAVRVRRALEEVGLGDSYLSRRPHELSGGQRQRVAIARALAVDPKVVILDEPTSALDLSVQAQVLNLLLDLQTRLSLSYLFISHDIDVIRHLCHRVYVMAEGAVVELGPMAQVLSTPREAYTRRLIEAAPSIPRDQVA